LSGKLVAVEVLSPTSLELETDDFVVLDETQRHRRRIKMFSHGGIEFMLDLPHAKLLKHGDILPLNDGRNIEVRAQPEHLLKVVATDQQHLVSLAWQIGNRHLAADIQKDHILIRFDHVIAEMLIGLGAIVEEVQQPFNPEGGAYTGHHHDE